MEKKLPPPYTEAGDMILESVRRHCGSANPNAPAVEMNRDATSALMRYLELQEEKKHSEQLSKKLEKEMQRMKGLIVAEMGAGCTALCEKDGWNYVVTYNPIRKPVIDKDNLEKLRRKYLAVYAEFVSISEARRFQVKVSAADAA